MRYPSYPSILGLGLQVLFTGVMTRDRPRRSFRVDSLQAVGAVTPPIQVLRPEFIPSGGPCLLLTNHYYRPGFEAWWISMAISAVVPVEVGWIVTAEHTYPGQKRGLVMRPLSRFYLACVARAYGFFSMPAMPPDPRQSQARAAAVRRVAQHARLDAGALIGLSPEGMDNARGGLARPPDGSGRFILHLAGLGLKLIPVGLYEEEGRLCVHFGPPFALITAPGLAKGELDRQVSDQVMQQIARLLPVSLRGEWQQVLEAERGIA